MSRDIEDKYRGDGNSFFNSPGNYLSGAALLTALSAFGYSYNKLTAFEQRIATLEQNSKSNFEQFAAVFKRIQDQVSGMDTSVSESSKSKVQVDKRLKALMRIVAATREETGEYKDTLDQITQLIELIFETDPKFEEARSKTKQTKKVKLFASGRKSRQPVQPKKKSTYEELIDLNDDEDDEDEDLEEFSKK